MKSLAIVAVLAMAGILSGQPGHAQVVNGNFDEFVPTNATGGGWTTTDGDSNGGWRSDAGLPDNGFVLNASGAFATDPTISQSVSGLIPGATYNVTGNFRSYYSFASSGGTKVFGVAVNHVFIFESAGIPEKTWHSFSGSFVASDTSALLQLSGERNGWDLDFAIDNIAMTLASAPTDTPEPGALAFVFAGSLAGAAVIRRRYRTRL